MDETNACDSKVSDLIRSLTNCTLLNAFPIIGGYCC